MDQTRIEAYKKEWEEKYKDIRIIAGVDELTRTSGIIQKMKGFEHFLKNYPIYIGIFFLFVVMILRSRGSGSDLLSCPLFDVSSYREKKM